MKQVYKGEIETKFYWIIPILLGVSRSDINLNGLLFGLHITPFITIGINWEKNLFKKKVE